MSLSRVTDRAHVLKAMDEFNRSGRVNFLANYGFKKSRTSFVDYDGVFYDSEAILAVAHGFADPAHGPLKARDLKGRPAQIKGRIEELGFVVVPASTPWSDDEVRFIVDDYLEMLAKEKGGVSYSKAGHRRLLMPNLSGRTKSSIEFKHQNISAVMQDLQLPFILGYKPRGNYQHMLKEMIERRLVFCREGQLPFYDRLADPPNDQVAPDMNEVEWVRPPQPILKPERRPAQFQARKTDFVKREAMNHHLGKEGERLVFETERKRLFDAGRHDLADNVRWVSVEDGDGAGYDIASFELSGEPIFIEVKTTRCGREQSFLISDNEYRFAELNPGFRLYRIYDFGKSPKLFILTGPLSEEILLPKQYEIRFKTLSK